MLMHCVTSSCPYVALLHIVLTLAIVRVVERSMIARESVREGMCNVALIRRLMQLSAYYVRRGMSLWGTRASTRYAAVFLFSVSIFCGSLRDSRGPVERYVVGSSQHLLSRY